MRIEITLRLGSLLITWSQTVMVQNLTVIRNNVRVRLVKASVPTQKEMLQGHSPNPKPGLNLFAATAK